MKNINEQRKREPDVVPFERRETSQQQTTLIPPRQMEDLRLRWTGIQSSFVDDPRKSIEEANNLVATAIKQIDEVFLSQRSDLEKQWNRGEQVSTEDLRLSMQRYREFFERLLKI